VAGFEGKDQDKSLGSGGVRPLLCTSLLVGVSPAECLVLADSPTGLTAPAKASMRSIDVETKTSVQSWHLNLMHSKSARQSNATNVKGPLVIFLIRRVRRGHHCPSILCRFKSSHGVR